ncbi:MAG: hypothetical protein OXG40_14865 [Acidimicrobiaceae bacterium]|nr:hypothetical protein [Acidimicrobiaceae bacterium]MDE0516044.1 hypothetical protein [Acidimicrobiaceae bacterium]
MRFGLLALAVVALLAAGCGEADDDAGVITTSAVSAALADTVEVPVYQATTSATTLLTMPAMGADADPQPTGVSPTVVATVAHDRQHFFISIALPPGAQIAGGDAIEFEMWSDSERLVMDTRDYQRLVDAAPGTELGPLEPGLFFVDLAAIGSSHPGLLGALVGVSLPSLRDLADNLPAALDTIEQISEDPPIFVGSTTAASLIRARGADLEVAMRSTVAGMALVSPADVDELTELFTEVFSTAAAEVVIELDDQGLVSVLSTREDMSGLFTAVLEAESLAAGATDQEMREAQQALEGAELILETRSVYETDVELEVPLLPAATEDRTDEWREFLIDAGFDS